LFIPHEYMEKSQYSYHSEKSSLKSLSMASMDVKAADKKAD